MHRKCKTYLKYRKCQKHVNHQFRTIFHFLGWVLYGPSKPQKLRLVIWRNKDMSTALVKFTWVKSASSDVVKQHLTVNVVGADAPVVSVDLDPAIEEFGPVELQEKSQVVVTLVANDGVYDSSPCTLTFTLGDLMAPEPPTNLEYSIVDKVVTTPTT